MREKVIHILSFILTSLLFGACGSHLADDEYLVSGNIENFKKARLQLYEITLSQNYFISKIDVDADGNFKVKFKTKEKSLYGIRHQNSYIFFINDVHEIKLRTSENEFENYIVELSPESEALKQLVTTQKKLATEKVIADRLLYDKMVKTDTKIGNNPELLTLENKADESANDLRNYVTNYIDSVNNKVLAVAASSFLDMNEEYNYLRIFSNDLMNYNINPKQKNDLRLELDKIQDAFKFIAPLKKVKGFDLKNKEQEVSSFENKYVLLNIWATWCLSSREQVPYITKATEKYMNSDQIDFVNISIDENIDQWKDYIRKNSFSAGIHLCQPNGNEAPILKRFGVNYIPANFLLDKKGNIISSNLKYKQISFVIDSLLKNEN